MSSPGISRHSVLWILWGISAFIFVASPHFQDPDLFGHVTFGEWFWQHGEILRTDIFSFTAGGLRWINHEWGAELIMGGAFMLWGETGLIGLKILCLACSFSCLWFLLPTEKALSWRMVGVVAVFLVLKPILSIRPQMFSLLFWTFFCWLCCRRPRLGTILLPGLFLFWANIHGAFAGGLALYGLLVCLRPALSPIPGLSWKGWMMACLVTLCNPFGWRLWQGVGHAALGNPYTRKVIEDWQPLWETQTPGYMLLFVILFMICISFLWRKRNILLFRFYCVPFLVLTCVTLFSFRHIVFWSVWCALCLGETAFPERDARISGWIQVPVLCAMIGLFGFKSGSSFFEGKLRPQGDLPYPEKAITALQESDLKGRLLCHFNWGQFCIRRLYPHFKVSMDGRFDTVYPLAIFKELQVDFFNALNVGATLRKWQPDVLLLSRDDSKGLSTLLFRAGYTLFYEDEVATLWLPREKAELS